MNGEGSCLYVGKVVHQRVRPKRHRLSYSVFSICLDVDEIDGVAGAVKGFSRNRFNWASFHDRDHGAGDGVPVGEHIRGVLDAAGLSGFGERVQILCYPRILGYVFNPLSVYFCSSGNMAPGVIVYEVSNTFGERKSYVIPVAGDGGAVVRQACAKEMYVSPFTKAEGNYTFSISPPGGTTDVELVAITLRDELGAVLNARFQGQRSPLTSRGLASALLGHPLMTMKVMGGIHLEAARLFAKGVPIVARHVSPKFSFTVVGADVTGVAGTKLHA